MRSSWHPGTVGGVRYALAHTAARRRHYGRTLEEQERRLRWSVSQKKCALIVESATGI